MMMELIDREAVEKITWEEPAFTDALNVLSEVRDKVRELPTVQAVPIEKVLKIIEFEEKWLYQTRMSIRDIDIAFNAMKSKIKQIEGSDKE